jgi:hypothetical protein
MPPPPQPNPPTSISGGRTETQFRMKDNSRTTSVDVSGRVRFFGNSKLVYYQTLSERAGI